MFMRDSMKDFYNKTVHVFGSIYFRLTPMKKNPNTYFLILSKKTNKTFYRITNNFFIEKP